MDAIKGLMTKAEKSLEAAEKLFDGGYYDFAASRGYYSMFYCAEALLLSKGLRFSKHSGVISAFGEQFIKAKLLPSELHSYILDAFSQRGKGDYDIIPLVEEDAKDLLDKAKIFLEKAKGYLRGQEIID